MVRMTAKTKERLSTGLKKFQPILARAKEADINESDTVTIITDMLCDVFGYDKYSQITSEFAIKKTYCDIAIRLNGKVSLLLECKAIGIDLKEDHIRQATDYAANAGIDWVVLTNGATWQVYKIMFTKPVERILIYSFETAKLSPKRDADLELMYYLSIEAFAPNSKATLSDLYAQKQVMNRYVVGQFILTDAVVSTVRRSLQRHFQEVKMTDDEVREIIRNEVIRREIIEGEDAEAASKAISKAVKKLQAGNAQKPPKDTED